MAASHYSVPEVTWDIEDNKTVGETSQSGGAFREP
jgi:hypothetical protein